VFASLRTRPELRIVARVRVVPCGFCAPRGFLPCRAGPRGAPRRGVGPRGALVHVDGGVSAPAVAVRAQTGLSCTDAVNAHAMVDR
jgi:hypothetical protein